MRKEYDLVKLTSRRNPYARRLKQQVTIRLGIEIIICFNEPSEETGIPYQNPDHLSAVQFSTRVIGVVIPSPMSMLTRKRCPSAVTS